MAGLAPAQAASPASSGNLFALAARLLGKFTRRPAAGGALEHLTTLPLTSQSALVLVRFGEETLLLGATAQNINVLVRNRNDAAVCAPLDESSSRQEPQQK